MRTVTRTRVVVVAGRRPRTTAARLLGDVEPGAEAAVFVLGIRPTTRQRRMVEAALTLAAERRFELTAELVPAPSRLSGHIEDGDRIRVPAPSRLSGHIEDGDRIRVTASRREARRWRMDRLVALTADDG